ncbi:MAG TPA: helix-turn-helix domain-containing protein [Bacillota bacterium]|nr:helix-turn-helix domain-containing protein [Bacillota bacterium]
MEIGPYIKLNRIKQEMTQHDLAEGIVSLSYLSKIENGKAEASPNVMSLLCTRLGIELNNEVDNMNAINEKCQAWYELLYEVNDKDEIIRKYKELEALLGDAQSDSLIMFEIHKIRYFLILGQIDHALAQINELENISSTFDSLHQFYWYKFKGNYNTVHGDFSQAMRKYKQAEDKLNQLDLEEGEVADLQYTIAVTHSKLRNTLEAIDYANKALDIFRMKYNFIRCAECHIILGISYRRIRMYDKSIKNHNLAKHLGELDNNKQIIQLANHNLGYLHSANGDQEDAIHFYEEVADDEKIEVSVKLPAISSLIKEYYTIGNMEKASEMIERGLVLLEEHNYDDSYNVFSYIIFTYKHALNNDYDKFEKLVIKEFIPYLKKHKDFANLAVYTTMLGNHYESMHRYKDAVSIYKEANKAYKELANV